MINKYNFCRTFVGNIIAVLLFTATGPKVIAETYTLEQCRKLALDNNKELMIKAEKLKQSDYKKRQAFAAYLPALDFEGAYAYNQKKLSIFSEDQLLPVKDFNIMTQKYEFNVVKNPLTGQPVTTPEGTPIPSQVALIPKDAMEFDIHNVFFGAVTLTQPIFMGGKIVAMNQLAKYGKEIATEMRDNEAQNVIYAVDAAYWTVVSLKAKHELATSYVNLLDSLDRNVKAMLEQGVATRSDLLSVDVKLNEANVDLLKVENGLTLSRMALAQVCGLPIDSQISVADEGCRQINPSADMATTYDMQQVMESRPDLKALSLATDAMGAQKRVALADMLPNLALIGTYSFSNPNMFNGFEKRFSGMFSVGVMLKVPLWHWGGNYYKYRAASADQNIMRLQLEDAKEKVTLQVNQASFKAREAVKTYVATEANLNKAAENLRTAQIGFAEGVLTADDVMKAQTAWLKANSEQIDAMIDVQLSDTYLSKVLGTLQ